MRSRLWWIGVLFMAGSALFALGSAPLYAQLVERRPHHHPEGHPGVRARRDRLELLLGAVCFFAGARLLLPRD